MMSLLVTFIYTQVPGFSRSIPPPLLFFFCGANSKNSPQAWKSRSPQKFAMLYTPEGKRERESRLSIRGPMETLLLCCCCFYYYYYYNYYYQYYYGNIKSHLFEIQLFITKRHSSNLKSDLCTSPAPFLTLFSCNRYKTQ